MIFPPTYTSWGPLNVGTPLAIMRGGNGMWRHTSDGMPLDLELLPGRNWLKKSDVRQATLSKSPWHILGAKK